MALVHNVEETLKDSVTVNEETNGGENNEENNGQDEENSLKEDSVSHESKKIQGLSEFPEAADSVANSMYVDDLLDSSETVESTQNLRYQLTSLLASAGFNLRKWASNETAVIESIVPSDRLSTLDFGKEETLKIKTLGVMWKAKEDVCFYFSSQITGIQ
ncbi:Hypothetical predicted protein [Paramuricea clavata]|uniref:Uncharacterized protein n=1 Tax=Paramuricea clavata TaxID=317549 RepID=A0A7D9D8H2_PARCT|nr:Hypothetical predicted protein [Paramuricea clavata]